MESRNKVGLSLAHLQIAPLQRNDVRLNVKKDIAL